jgi:PPOX class probable F420-dependent enzyme
MIEPRAGRPYMPGYGTLPADQGSGLLPWSFAEERLRASRNYWVATTWPDGRPHAMPVWGMWDGTGLLFSSSKGSRKARNLLRDPRCVVTTEDAANPVVMEGVAELVSSMDELEAMLALENAKYGTDYGMDMLDPAGNAAFRVRPRWVFALTTDDFSGSPTRWAFV